MAFCGKCGTQVNDGVKFCPGCGAEIEAPTQDTHQQNNFSAKVAELNNTEDRTSDFEKSDVEQNKIMGILAYISWLVLIPIFAAPKSKFARFHANQGLVLAIAEIIWWIAVGILSAVLYAISWKLGFIVNLLYLANVLFLIMAIIGIMNAVNGKAKDLPVIGKFKILK